MREIRCRSVDDFLSQVRTAAKIHGSGSMELNRRLNRMEVFFPDCFVSIGMNIWRFYVEREGLDKGRDELSRAMSGED